jgi:hypothetical protein
MCIPPVAQLPLRTLDVSYCTELKHGTFNIQVNARRNVVLLQKSLTSLNLSYTNSLPGDSICDILTVCTSIQELRLGGLSSVNDKLLRSLADSVSASSLSLLDLENCDFISSEGLMVISSKCRNLTHLNISGCTRLKPDALICISDLKLLEYLNLSRCLASIEPALNTLTDNTIITIVDSCTQLQYLDLNYACTLSLETISSLSKLKLLQYVDLSYVRTGVSDSSVIDIINGCTSLRTLKLYRYLHSFKFTTTLSYFICLSVSASRLIQPFSKALRRIYLIYNCIFNYICI